MQSKTCVNCWTACLSREGRPRFRATVLVRRDAHNMLSKSQSERLYPPPTYHPVHCFNTLIIHITDCSSTSNDFHNEKCCVTLHHNKYIMQKRYDTTLLDFAEIWSKEKKNMQHWLSKLEKNDWHFNKTLSISHFNCPGISVMLTTSSLNFWKFTGQCILTVKTSHWCNKKWTAKYQPCL